MWHDESGLGYNLIARQSRAADGHRRLAPASTGVSVERSVVIEDNALAEEFVFFCLERRGCKWPELYDEMCRVASHRLFKGMGYTELKDHGVSLSLANIGQLAALAETLASSRTPQQAS
jgi:hypothetical protein